MPIDYKALKKLETLPASAQAMRDDERLLVLVKLRKDGRRPVGISARAEIGPQIFSAEIAAGELKRLETDPDVESVSISRRLPLMKEPRT
jgi:hypothetical protein